MLRFIEIEDENGLTREVPVGPRGFTDPFGRAPHTPRFLWDSDVGFGGHATYCASPGHSTAYYCSSDGSDEMVSDAWLEDHGLPRRNP